MNDLSSLHCLKNDVLFVYLFSVVPFQSNLIEDKHRRLMIGGRRGHHADLKPDAPTRNRLYVSQSVADIYIYIYIYLPFKIILVEFGLTSSIIIMN